MIRLLFFILLTACSTEAAMVRQALPSGGDGCSIDEESGVCRCLSSPIIVDVEGDGYDLTGPDDGVMFRLQGNRIWQWSWTRAGSDDSFLVLDRNHDGYIGDGSEMFGDGALQITNGSPNGFTALAVYDADSSGSIDAGDPVWSELRLWRDADHDGVSQPYEMISLDKARIASISVSYASSSIIDGNGNQFRFAGIIDASWSMAAYDVWLVAAARLTSTGGATNATVMWTCKAWSYAIYIGSPPVDALPCIGPGTGFDPIVLMSPNIPDYPLPSYATMVARTATLADDHGATMINASTKMRTDMGWGTTCVVGPFPSPDIDPQGGYPYEITNTSYEGRVKCQSVAVEPPPSTGGC